MTVGKTRDAGWQIGVSRVLDHPLEVVWKTLASNPEVWLVAGARLPAEVGAPWHIGDREAGELRSLRHHDRVRLTLRSADGTSETTVQAAVRSVSRGRTTVRFHQGRMRDATEREAQRAHWVVVVARLAEHLGAG